jgi:glutaredoxin
MNKKIILFGFLMLLFVNLAFSQTFTDFKDFNTTVHLFELRGCPDCAKQKYFLENIVLPKYPNINIISYSIMDSANQALFHEMMAERDVEKYNVMVPVVFIGNNVFQQYYEDDKELIFRAIEGKDVQNEIDAVRGQRIINVPFVGPVNLGDYSLFLSALVIGSLDGLNICSIGALILILMIVLSFNSRKKIFLYGGLFILTSVLIYGVLVFAWTAIFDILASYIGPLNLVIAIAAFIGGVIFLTKFVQFIKYGPACEYNGNRFVVNATKKVKEAFSNEKRQAIFLISSVVVFATIITLVELPCSFGLPMIYGGILTVSGLSLLGYFWYVLLYLFFYMLIEIIIFIGALITKEVWFAETNFIIWIYGFGTAVLFFLSYYYLFGI